MKIKDILFGLIDGITPGIGKSIQKTNEGQMQINKARLIACLLAYGCFIGVIKGWIKLEQAAEILKVLLTSDVS